MHTHHCLIDRQFLGLMSLFRGRPVALAAAQEAHTHDARASFGACAGPRKRPIDNSLYATNRPAGQQRIQETFVAN